jgi:hypothetical protein
MLAFIVAGCVEFANANLLFAQIFFESRRKFVSAFANLSLCRACVYADIHDAVRAKCPGVSRVWQRELPEV